MSIGLEMSRWQNQASSRMKRVDRVGSFHHTRQCRLHASETSDQERDSSIPILIGRGGLFERTCRGLIVVGGLVVSALFLII